MSCAVSQPGQNYPPLSSEARDLPRDLKGFRGYHAGESIVVCGCGSSLRQLVSPERFITIGVNDVGRLFEPDYLVVLNPRQQFRGDRFRFVEESHAQALFTHLDLGIRHSHIVRFRLGKFGGVDFSDPNSLHYTRNSPYLAVCLAAHMGAKRIGLIGVDFTDDHFFARTGQHPLTREFAQIDREYKALYDSCARSGIELVNLSEQSRLSAIPKISLEKFAGAETSKQSLQVVSYATTPVAGVPAILARCIAARTPHRARTVWATNSYGNGVAFEGDVEWRKSSSEARDLLQSADVIIAHNGKIDPSHQALLADKAVITMAHNYMWNVDSSIVSRGFPGMVVGQYQATLPEFKGWNVVPNPIPLWEADYQPGPKPSEITICYTPSGRHESYPKGHRLYWHGKGYVTTMKVLETLARRFPLRLEVLRDRQVSHAESLAMKKRSHIVIDECVTGSYHRNSLEGLAAGCVVINGLGLVPSIADVLRACSEDSGEIPFVQSSLGDLENVLTGLIERGPDALAGQGASNRRWMEQNWDFQRQWARFWEPAIEAALLRTGVQRSSVSVAAGVRAHEKECVREEAAPEPQQPGISVVVPHGGQERLPLLQACLENLRICQGVNEIIVADMGSTPFAVDVARRFADKYIFVQHHDAFERARALNAGTALAENALVLWLDNDLILPADFITKSVADLRARQLDYLIPYAAVQYLSEADSQRVIAGTVNPARCTPARTCRALYVCGGAGLVRRSFVLDYGGLSERFRGWGGEDGAWWHKARLLGRADVVQRHDQYLYHLFHLNSGANGGSQHRDSNPYYAENVAELDRVRAIRDRNSYLQRFPAQPLFSGWKGKRVLLVSPPGGEASPWSPDGIARALTDLTGVQVEHMPLDRAGERKDQVHADAIVFLGTPDATAFALNPDLQDLWKRAVVVHDGSALNAEVIERLREADSVLCMDGPDLKALQHAGLRPWPIPCPRKDSNPSHTAALRIVQPLSILLGRANLHNAAETAICSNGKANGIERGNEQNVSTLNDVTILITSFLRPGYLKDCLAGIRRNLPECKVVVVDDSGDQNLGRGLGYPFVYLPFDSGLSAKRNAGVKACTTQYLLMGSDDFDFSTAGARAGIEKLVRVLEEHPTIDVAGGHHNNHRYEGFMELTPGSHIKETRLFASNQPASLEFIHKEYQAYKVDIIVNYFLARTESIRAFPWDERMKIGGEHGDWFLALKDAGKMVVWVADVNVDELPRDRRKEHPDYGRYRGRAISLGHRIFLEKHGIKYYFGFDDPVPAGLRAAPKAAPKKILIGVITCRQNAERVRAQQDTWIPKAIAAGYDVQVFDGERLAVADDYYSLIQKTQALCRWALAQGYERLLKVDDDCCIRVHQLRADGYDYAGIVIGANDLGSVVPPCVPAKPPGTYPHNYASGGAYWLSRRAMSIIADAQPNGDWAEDRFVGNTLATHGIMVQGMPDFTWVKSGHVPSQWTVLTQLPTAALMRKAFY